jgi:hypothetical protein
MKILDYVFGMKKKFGRRVKRKDDCHFSGYRKLNNPVRISFVIVRFGFDKKKFQPKKVAFLDQLRICLYQNTFDVDNDYGGIHKINDICMEGGINNKFGWGSREGIIAIYT